MTVLSKTAREAQAADQDSLALPTADELTWSRGQRPKTGGGVDG